MSAEAISKPSRSMYLRGFDRRGAAATLHDARATGFATSERGHSDIEMSGSSVNSTEKVKPITLTPAVKSWIDNVIVPALLEKMQQPAKPADTMEPWQRAA